MAKIILSIADQNGGAHVDPELEETYYKLARLNSTQHFTGFIPSNPTAEDLLKALETKTAPKVSPAYYTARQIAHEVLVSLSGYSQLTPNWRTLYHFDKSHYDGAAFAAGALYSTPVAGPSNPT